MCCVQQRCCRPAGDVSAPATSLRVCACTPDCSGGYECEGCGWSESCVWRMKVHEGACSEFQRKVVLNVVPEVVPVRHCQCSRYWPHSVLEECYDRQAGRNMCECNGGGIPHTRGQLNKCQLCSGWLEEVWRSKEPTRTFLRFMFSRLRERSDSALGDRFELHVRHAAIVSHYNWVPPPVLDGKRRAYYSSSMSGRSYEAAYWLKYVTKELWMNKALFKQLMLGRFRIGTDPAPTSCYVCESDVCGTNMTCMARNTLPCLSKRRESSSLIDFLDQNPSLARSHLDFFESFLIFIRPSNRPTNKSPSPLASQIPPTGLRLSNLPPAPS